MTILQFEVNIMIYNNIIISPSSTYNSENKTLGIIELYDGNEQRMPDVCRQLAGDKSSSNLLESY